MPTSYQRRRTKEVKQRNSNMNRKAVPFTPDTPEPLYEVRVGQVGNKPNWWPEEKLRAKWPQLYDKLGMKFKQLESYIRSNRRVVLDKAVI